MPSFFVSDLHGSVERYRTLFSRIDVERPEAVFIGGDLLPTGGMASIGRGSGGFLRDFLFPEFGSVRDSLGSAYPRIFLILGNDDPRAEESAVFDGTERGLWEYVHDRRVSFGAHAVYGYAYVPPTPFLLKDWERYDVSRYIDPGAVSPEEGRRTVPLSERDARLSTIREDLERIAGDEDLANAIFLFHTPPYRTNLDRAALDGRSVDHVPLDVHVGSIAVRRFIADRQPLVTLHGHVHESARLTGSWRDSIGSTVLLGGAHDGPELALVRFDPDDPEGAEMELL